MKVKKFIIALINLTFLFACTAQNHDTKFVTTSAPLAMIIKEIVGTRGTVEYIVPPNASPHTYTPKPSDAQKISRAKAFFYIAKNNDGWATKLTNPNIIETLRLLNEDNLLNKEYFGKHIDHHHDHSYSTDSNKNDSFDYEKIDSHFWTDPIVVQSLISVLVDTLSKLDPKNSSYYRSNGDAFSKKLSIIHKQIESLTANIKDKPIFLHHPSFLYFIKRYGLTYGGSLEPNPGQELTPKGLSDIISKVKNSGVRAIFSEPQLPDKIVKMIANNTGVAVFQLDPIGTNFKNYNDFILYNANKLKEALE